MPHTYEAVLVHREPHPSRPPTLTEVDRIVGVSGISWLERMNGPGSATISFLPEFQSAVVKRHLRDLISEPAEVWLRRDDRIVAAGPLLAIQVQGKTATATIPGLAEYLTSAYVEPGKVLSFQQTEQLEIAKALVDYWQGLPYGHVGLDTSRMAAHPSGVKRDRTYDGNEAAHQIGQRLTELGAVLRGFDWRIDPHTRQILTGYPHLGQDLSATIIIDRRSIRDASATVAVTPQDYGTIAYGWTDLQQQHIAAAHENPNTMKLYGRSGIAAGYTDMKTAQDLTDAITDRLAGRSTPVYQPAPRIVPSGFTSEQFTPGDTVTYDYDHGFGPYSFTARVESKTITVSDDGEEEIAVRFL